jgi:hypothetical protein
VIAALSDFEPIRFPAPGSQPRNVIDAAIASVTNPVQVVLGKMLNIANYTPELLAPRPGMTVTKAGRTTGVTSGTIRAIRVRGVQVNYGTRQNPIIATFDNAITITGAGGAPFSNPLTPGRLFWISSPVVRSLYCLPATRRQRPPATWRRPAAGSTSDRCDTARSDGIEQAHNSHRRYSLDAGNTRRTRR